ncbi:MAG TPA: hypothetical protein DCL06_11245 [Corynebacterium variabile]|uniref:Uncharacterized protein n=1 Tax=Corynebacterium variabile TaxID=1727 RepID=A0A3B9QWD0_9CORY|nr:hypothetical protein [Corynebacterium variabile]
MSNPTFSTGDLTRKAGTLIEKFHLVKEDADGVVTYAGAADFPLGVITESAEPGGDRPDDYVAHGLPELIRVGTSQRVVKITTNGTIGAGAAVYAAANGEVAASGSVKVGIADKATVGGLTRVHLFHPSALIGGSSNGGAEGE